MRSVACCVHDATLFLATERPLLIVSTEATRPYYDTTIILRRIYDREVLSRMSMCRLCSFAARLAKGPALLTVDELVRELAARGIRMPKTPKSSLVRALEEAMQPKSAEAAAAEKAMAGESLAVEHIAELAPAQARRARSLAQKRRGVDELVSARKKKPRGIGAESADTLARRGRSKEPL